MERGFIDSGVKKKKEEGDGVKNGTKEAVEKDSLCSKFKAAKEASKSNPRSTPDFEEESDVDEVYFHIWLGCRASPITFILKRLFRVIHFTRETVYPKKGNHDQGNNKNKARDSVFAIGIDWLSKLKAKIVCFEKILEISLSNREILEVHGERPKGNLKQLMTMKVDELKLEVIPVVRNYPGVFLEDLSGLPSSRKVEFRIDLIPGAMSRNKVIAYTSRQLKIHERNYTTYDLELGAVPEMKKDLALYVRKCLTCFKVKTKNQKPSRRLQQPEVLEWMWEKITMDFITKLPRCSGGHDAIWVIVDQLTKSAHLLAIREDYKWKGERNLIGPEIVQETTAKFFQIKERLKAARDRQKRYANNRREPLEFSIHDTFHVSNMKRFMADVNLHVPLEEIKIDNELHFVEELIEIMDHKVKKLRQSCIPIVKVRWHSRRGPEFTWERENEMKRKYPQLFDSASA
nr:hypothetical protein [Tanacetum cinerariifolium]